MVNLLANTLMLRTSRQHSRTLILLVQTILLGVFMGISNSSFYFSRKSVRAFLSAPVQSLFAMLTPSNSALASDKIAFSDDRKIKQHSIHKQGCNTNRSWLLQQSTTRSLIKSCQTHGKPGVPNPTRTRVKIIREFDAGISPACAGRMVISGSMVDVCNELERLTQCCAGDREV